MAESPDCKWTPAVAVEFDNIISKPILEKDDDFKQFINKEGFNLSYVSVRLLRNDFPHDVMLKVSIVILELIHFFNK